ncbi:MAG: uracil-DNA glycosylase [Patescibacteria group bacterium]
MSSSNKQKRLDQIAQSIIDDGVCPDLAKQATQLVMGAGDPDASVVFIGEAPGKKEDELGQPFVGASGKFLDEMLESIHLKRSQVYITNIVKYRPPSNRDPSREEKDAFTPYLERQLEVISPKVVVTLGRHSGEYLLPDIKISRDHGNPFRLKWNPESHQGKGLELVVLPLYHPAAALYNGNMRETLMYDFAKIPIIIKKLTNGEK